MVNNFYKHIMVPNYIYAARVNPEHIPLFEKFYYEQIKFYPSSIKDNSEMFNYAVRIGYAFMDTLKKQLETLDDEINRSKLNICDDGDQGFVWEYDSELIENDSTKEIICVGAGTNISFELMLAKKYPDAKIKLLDPSPQAVKYVSNLALPSNLEFLPMGLSNIDGELLFHKPSTKGLGSLSSIALQPGHESFQLPVKRLPTILQENKFCNQITYFKFDIEGSEHDVIEDMILNSIRPKQIAFELDQPVPPWTMESTIKKLLAYEYSLVKIWGLNLLFIDSNIIG